MGAFFDNSPKSTIILSPCSSVNLAITNHWYNMASMSPTFVGDSPVPSAQELREYPINSMLLHLSFPNSRMPLHCLRITTTPAMVFLFDLENFHGPDHLFVKHLCRRIAVITPVFLFPFFCFYMLHVYITPIKALLMPSSSTSCRCQCSIIFVLFPLLFYFCTTKIKAPWVISSTTCHGHH